MHNVYTNINNNVYTINVFLIKKIVMQKYLSYKNEEKYENSFQNNLNVILRRNRDALVLILIVFKGLRELWELPSI